MFCPLTGYTQNLMPDKPAFLQKQAPKTSVMRHKVITKPVVEQPEKPVLKSTGIQATKALAPAEHVSTERERVLEKYKALAAGLVSGTE